MKTIPVARHIVQMRHGAAHKISPMYLSRSKTVSFILIFLVLCGCSYSSKTSKRMLDSSKQHVCDIIIVPGIPFDTAAGKWGDIMKARVYWSKYILDNGIAKNVMYSGSSVYTPYYEARIMALYAEAIGIKKKNIYTETLAKHSTENIYYGYQKAKQLGFKKIGLATDPFQAKMLTSFVHKKVSPDVVIIPIIFDTLKAMEPQMIDPAIDYSKAYNKDFIPITKSENFWQRMQGTMGKRIDTAAYK
ncbi:ElyC/SanA/YdcF family protein [Parafilimonas terrae]|nr:ElyC/SanA/YdcF family protein [Parafilimonas terrae]